MSQCDLSIPTQFFRDYIKNNKGSFWLVSISKKLPPKQKHFKKAFSSGFEQKLLYFIERNQKYNENIYFSLIR